METLGRLASGFAHDFNNLLSVIIGYTDLVLDKLPADSPNRARVEGIGKAAQRAADLARQMLAFSRQRPHAPGVIDLNAAVAEAVKLLRRLIPANIELKCSLWPEILTVTADPSQIDQVMLNLAINARDAMPGGGTLRIETAIADLDETYANLHPPVRPGRYVSLSVSDTGVGMDRTTQLRLFEAFFTTKEPGKGTGLGLATIYNIVNRVGGYIWVYSEPKMGTTIKLFLPPTEREVPSVAPVSDAMQALRGDETILVVEDAAPLRELLRDMLEHSGYTVLDASSGRDALETAAKCRDKIKLVVSDVVMPEMSGPDFAREIQRILPDAKIMFMSGYPQELMLRYGVEHVVPVLLQKPFTRETLLRNVRGVLDGNLKASDISC